MSNNQILKLRRSAVPGKVPSTSSLAFGELALNTHDGYVFIKKSGSNGEEIVVVGAGSSGSFSGSFFGTSSWARNSLTASYAPAYLPLIGGIINGDLTINGTASIAYLNVLYETASVIYSSGSNQFGDAADDVQTLFGSVIIPTGSLVVSGSISSTSGLSGSLHGTSSWASDAVSSSYALSASQAQNTVSSSYAASASNSAFAATASNILGGAATYIPFFNTNTTLGPSTMFQVSNSFSTTSIAINETNITSDNPEALYVFQTHPTSINVLTGKGNLNSYLQNNIQNTNQGVSASSDVVATANNGNESTNYIDMGINSENYSAGFVGGANDAYLYSIANNLHIGNANDNGTHVGFFVGGTDVEANNKLQLNPNNQHKMSGSLDISGSLNVNAGVTASLYGTASWANNSISSSYALTASYASNVPETASYALTSSAIIGGQSNYIALWDTGTSLSSSVLYQSGSSIGINTNLPTTNLEISGSLRVSGKSQNQIYEGTNATLRSGSIGALIANSDNLFLNPDTAVGLVASPRVIISGSASSGTYNSIGAVFSPYADREYLTNKGNILVTGIEVFASRASVNSNTGTFFLTGVSSNVGHGDNHWNTNTSNTATAIIGNVSVQKATVATAYGVRAFLGVSTSTNATNGAVTTYYGVHTSATVGNTLGALASVGTYYDAYFTGASIVGSGTITNRWGIFQSSSLHKNYFAGNTLFGSTTDLLNYKTQISGGLYVADKVVLAASGAYVGIGTTTPNAHLDVSGSAIVSGSITVLQGITGSLLGTASNAISSSYALTASYANNVPATASYALNAISSSQAERAVSSSRPFDVYGSTIFSTQPRAGRPIISQIGAIGNVLIGYQAGYDQNPTSTLANSIAIGDNALYSVNTVGNNTTDNIAIGQSSGYATATKYGIMIGSYAGSYAYYAKESVMLGLESGRLSLNASSSIMIGTSAGSSISQNDSIGGNNIIIGTKVTLEKNRANSINIGGLIFGTGSYYAPLASSSFSGSANGRVGINQPLPLFSLDVSGSGRYANGLEITGSLVSPNITGSLLGTASWANNALNSVTSSYILNAVSASYAATASTADDFTVRGTLTAQTIVVQTITSSTDFVTGSTKFGTLQSNTHQFTGSVGVLNGLNVVGGVTGSLLGTASWASNAISSSYSLSASQAQNAVSSSYPFRVTGSSLYSYNTSQVPSSIFQGGIYIGTRAGYQAYGSFDSYFIGQYAGNQAPNSVNSNFIGYFAGNGASSAANSNFIGDNAGYNAVNSIQSNFIGASAGYQTTDAEGSNFIGYNAGANANSASYSNFIGYSAGQSANNTKYSNFFGYTAGDNAKSASYSTLIGYQVGYNVELGASGVSSNNIIIGTNITLENRRKDSINLGGLIFGTGSYSTTTGNPFSGSANGRIGINQPLPLFSLDVSGSGRYSNGLEVTGSLVVKDFLKVDGLLSGSLIPSGSELYDLGSDTNRFRSLYLAGTTIHLGNIKLEENNGTLIIIPDSGSGITETAFSGSFTGSFNGTSSWAINAVSASQSQNTVSSSYALLATTSSYSLDSDKLDGKDSTIFATTGSNTFIGSQIVTGSLSTSGSNSLLGNTTLSGSIIISGSLGTDNPTVKIYGDTTHNGYIRFDPVLTNIDSSISASYIYVSGSTNDLYFSQNGNGYNNTTRLRWLEGNLYTGLLNGGLITIVTGSTTFNLSSGSGIVVNLNASLTDNPYPIIKYVNWSNFTNVPLTYLTSSIQSYIGIDDNGQITQQNTPFTDGEYNTKILIGSVLHQNKSTINASITYPNVAYGYKQRTYDFIKAFGPLKLSGYNLNTSSSLGLTVGSGTAFAEGRNYQVDPNNPSYIIDPGTSVSKIFRYYQSGSEFVQDTNGGLGYTVIDPLNYNPAGSGSLTPVPGTGVNRQWSIQRIFWYPNSATKGIVVYYGNQTYANEIDAAANISYEQFIEVENTKQNAVYLGALLLRNDATFTDSTSYRILPGGIFRNVGGSGGGGNITSLLLSQLGDVTISGPTSGQALVYNSAVSKWQNTSYISASISGNAVTATTAQTASYVLNAVSSSYVLSASQAQNSVSSSYALTSTSASQAQNAVSSSIATTSSLALRNILTASAAGSTITFTKGDNTTFNVTLTTATAETASYIASSNVDGPLGKNSVLSSSYAISASQAQNAVTASYVLNAVSSSYALSSSQAQNAVTASYSLNAVSASYALSASQAQNSTTASYVLNAISSSYSLSSSYALNSTSASFATQASTASYVLNAISSSYALSSSQAQNSVTASYVLNAVSASYALSASQAQNTISSSFATRAITASYADNLTVAGTLTAQTLVVQTVTSSIDFVTGSTRFGTLLANTHQFTGSVSMTGSLTVVGAGITSSLFGTASWANNAISSSYALSASQAQNSISSSYPIAISGSTIYSPISFTNTGFNTDSSIFIGVGAGYDATNANNSNFLGSSAGSSATNAQYSNFFGTSAGDLATGAYNSNFIGANAGVYATNANNSNFLGNSAGDLATDASYSNFLGYQAGREATNAYYSNFLGNNAGYQATDAYSSNFIGASAGESATTANYSNFIGYFAGYIATNANDSNFIGNNVGNAASNAGYSNFIGSNTGNAATNANNSNFLGNSAGVNATDANNSNFLGLTAGYEATNAASSNFIGPNAGYQATNAGSSNFIGNGTGYRAYNADVSNFIGQSAGSEAELARLSNFIGNFAGYQATSASVSNFIGDNAGYQAINAIESNFIGYVAGYGATNANNSNFIGYYAGGNAVSASYSTLIGWRAGYNLSGLGIKSNNIIIGTNITLATGRQDSINLGGLIFGTGSYSTTTGNPFSGSANGRIGINQPLPLFSLDVSGSGRYTSGLTVTGSLIAPTITGSLQGTASWANNSVTSSYILNAVSASYALSASQAQNALTASYILNAVSASYALSASQTQNAVTASYILNAVSASFATSASQAQNAVTASYILNAVSSSFATNATTALTASYSNNFTIASQFTLDATLTDYATVASSVVGSNNLFNQATGSYTSAFFKYTVTSGSSTRAGEVVAAWNGTSVQFYDNSTVDIGNTTAVTSSVSIVTGNVQFNVQTNTSGWRIKSLTTFI